MENVFLASRGAWVGECAQDATKIADVPSADDQRWIKGIPAELDKQFLTLSPFYPSGRLGVCVERKSSNPLSRYPNHPAFAACIAWMKLDQLEWRDIAA